MAGTELTLRLPPDLAEQLRVLAVASNHTVEDIVECQLRAALAPARHPEQVGVRLSEQMGAAQPARGPLSSQEISIGVRWSQLRHNPSLPPLAASADPPNSSLPRHAQPSPGSPRLLHRRNSEALHLTTSLALDRSGRVSLYRHGSSGASGGAADGSASGAAATDALYRSESASMYLSAPVGRSGGDAAAGS